MLDQNQKVQEDDQLSVAVRQGCCKSTWQQDALLLSLYVNHLVFVHQKREPARHAPGLPSLCVPGSQRAYALQQRRHPHIQEKIS